MASAAVKSEIPSELYEIVNAIRKKCDLSDGEISRCVGEVDRMRKIYADTRPLLISLQKGIEARYAINHHLYFPIVRSASHIMQCVGCLTDAAASKEGYLGVADSISRHCSILNLLLHVELHEIGTGDLLEEVWEGGMPSLPVMDEHDEGESEVANTAYAAAAAAAANSAGGSGSLAFRADEDDEELQLALAMSLGQRPEGFPRQPMAEAGLSEDERRAISMAEKAKRKQEE